MERLNGPTVLLVEHDAGERLLLGSWLEDAGFAVETCPGPTGPDYTCIGARGGRCALAAAADIVVLDLQLASDIAMEGTPAWHILTYYAELGKPIVALSAASDPVHPVNDELVHVVPRPPSRDSLLDAIRTIQHRQPKARS